MATARKLIYDGLREGNIIPANAAQSATDAQNAEALPLLNTVMLELLGEVVGEEPKDWAVPPSARANATPYWNVDPAELRAEQQPTRGFEGSDPAYKYPPPNSRLILKVTTAPLTVYWPPSPDDGALMQLVDLNSTQTVTMDGNGRFINDADTLVLDPPSSFNGFLYMYRADRGGWYRIQDLAIDDASALPQAFDDLLSILLYFRLAPRYGSTPSIATVGAYKSKLGKLKKRYRQKQPVVAPAKGPTNAMQEYGGTFNIRS